MSIKTTPLQTVFPVYAKFCLCFLWYERNLGRIRDVSLMWVSSLQHLCHGKNRLFSLKKMGMGVERSVKEELVFNTEPAAKTISSK